MRIFPSLNTQFLIGFLFYFFLCLYCCTFFPILLIHFLFFCCFLIIVFPMHAFFFYQLLYLSNTPLILYKFSHKPRDELLTGLFTYLSIYLSISQINWCCRMRWLCLYWRVKIPYKCPLMMSLKFWSVEKYEVSLHCDYS